MSDQLHTQTQGGAPVKTTDEARQGVEGHGVRYVLFWSFGAAIVVMGIAWFVFFAH